MSGPSTLPSPLFWKPTVILTTATLICLVPFADKAFHVDDPVFLWIARQIQSNPTDFFGFIINWNGDEIPMVDLATNPPTNSYFIALAAYLFGWSEIALHLVYIIPALGVVLGTHYLARQLCSRPLLAALAALATPVFLVSSSNVMCDTLMLAFWVWAVGLWVRGAENRDCRFLLASSFLAALAIMTKFFAVSLIPLLFVYSLAQRRGLTREQCFFLIPAATILGYEWITHMMYGEGLFSRAMVYTGSIRGESSEPFLFQGMIGLSFTGGCLATVIFFALAVESKKVLSGAVLLLIFFMALAAYILPDVSFKNAYWPTLFQFSIFMVGGVGLLVLAVLDFRKHQNPVSMLLLLWVFGTFVFAAKINWMVNGRSILPMIPAMGILLARRIEMISVSASGKPFWSSAVPIIPSMILAMLVAWSDHRMANSVRDTAEELTRQYGRSVHSLWFGGHWGFQYYMQAGGGKPVRVGKSDFKTGDIIIVPENNAVDFVLTADARENMLVRVIEWPSLPWLATMNHTVAAGFYSHLHGILPFAFGKVPPDQYTVLRLKI